jgi:hypothetical protein
MPVTTGCLLLGPMMGCLVHMSECRQCTLHAYMAQINAECIRGSDWAWSACANCMMKQMLHLFSITANRESPHSWPSHHN